MYVGLTLQLCNVSIRNTALLQGIAYYKNRRRRKVLGHTTFRTRAKTLCNSMWICLLPVNSMEGGHHHTRELRTVGAPQPWSTRLRLRARAGPPRPSTMAPSPAPAPQPGSWTSTAPAARSTPFDPSDSDASSVEKLPPGTEHNANHTGGGNGGNIGGDNSDDSDDSDDSDASDHMDDSDENDSSDSEASSIEISATGTEANANCMWAGNGGDIGGEDSDVSVESDDSDSDAGSIEISVPARTEDTANSTGRDNGGNIGTDDGDVLQY